MKNISNNFNETNYCYKSGSSDHLANACKHNLTICSKCNVKGHLAKVCFKGRKEEYTTTQHRTNQIKESLAIHSEHVSHREKFLVKVNIEGGKLSF